MPDEIDQGDLEDYVRVIADRLGLRDWQFHLSRREGGEDHAEFDWMPGRRIGQIRFFDPFYASAPETQRATVVHELLHAHLNGVLGAADVAEELMGKIAFRPFYDAMERRLEDGIDAIAEAVASNFPLPKWASAV